MMFSFTVNLTDEQAKDLLAKLQAQYGTVTVTPPPVIPPPVVTPPPAPVTQVLPKQTGTRWHSEIRLPEVSNAAKNFNWLMEKCGETFAFAYMYRSPSNITYLLHDYFKARGDEAEASRIINTMGNQGRYAPEGFIVPSTFMVRNQTFTSRKPESSIKLPFPDDNAL
jgi:hypothetical protein